MSASVRDALRAAAERLREAEDKARRDADRGKSSRYPFELSSDGLAAKFRAEGLREARTILAEELVDVLDGWSSPAEREPIDERVRAAVEAVLAARDEARP